MAQETGKKRNTVDKFYTNPVVANLCVGHMNTLIPNPGGFTWIEPSAGAGALVTALQGVLPEVTPIAIDLIPDAPSIQKADFLTWPAPPGRLIFFGNPPFGRQGSLARKFIGRAAELGAEWIAFILPRSFEKPSLQRAFPPLYHKRLSIRLQDNAFLVNTEPHDVPCVFQIWEKMAEPRARENPIEPIGFRFVAATETHDLVVRRVGVYAGRAFVAGATFSRQSHYFIKLDQPLRAAALASQLSAHTFPSNTTGPRSLSKGEIATVLNDCVAAA